jgi:quercetin 2,3-dioxygenase
VHVARGSARVAGHELRAGDAVAVSGEKSVEVQGLEAGEDAEILVFDLA